MSKYVKNLITEDLRDRFKDLRDALLVNMVGLDANANTRLRAELREKNMNVLVVKNSLAQRATEGSPLGVMFDGLTGSSAVCWGGDDIVSLAKEVTRLARDEQFEAFQPRGGVMDGEKLTQQQVAEVSRWPGREELLGQLAAQILGPGARLAAQLTGPAATLAGQIAQKAEEVQEDHDDAQPGASGEAGGGPPEGT
jgi:large subunit ribosomal protein L10